MGKQGFEVITVTTPNSAPKFLSKLLFYLRNLFHSLAFIERIMK